MEGIIVISTEMSEAGKARLKESNRKRALRIQQMVDECHSGKYDEIIKSLT